MHHSTHIEMISHFLPHLCYDVAVCDPIAVLIYAEVPVMLPAVSLIHFVLYKAYKKKLRGLGVNGWVYGG
jgi:hypothetical protein